MIFERVLVPSNFSRAAKHTTECMAEMRDVQTVVLPL